MGISLSLDDCLHLKGAERDPIFRDSYAHDLGGSLGRLWAGGAVASDPAADPRRGYAGDPDPGAR